MNWLWRGIKGFGWDLLVACVAMYLGWHIGYGRGAREVVDLVIELRGGTELPEPWDRGRI